MPPRHAHLAAAGDIADEDIQMPDPGNLVVTLQHIDGVTGPLISNLIQGRALSAAYIDALLQTCERYRAQNAALRARLESPGG